MVSTTLAKEFIKKEVKKINAPFSPEQFTELFEGENSLIIFEIDPKSYVLSDIARIVENNDARVINLLTLFRSGNKPLFVSIKINVMDLLPILRSFERFDYQIIYSFSRNEEVNDFHQERLEELLHYLEM